MTKHIFTTILLGTLLTTGVVSAFQEPGTIFPGGNASAPVHTGGGEQKKSGPFWAQYLKAGLLPFPAAVATANLAGFIIGDKVALAPQGFFTQVFLPGQESQLRVGSSDSGDLYNATFTNRAPVTIDLVGRATGDNDPKGREALALLADGGFCQTSTTIVTNTPAIQLYSDKNTGPADLLARQIQLKGGEPQPGKILISVDRNGNAVWATPRLQNGNIIFDTTPSPVQLGQDSCKVAPILGCTIAGYPNYNPNATQDNGSCTCPSGQDFINGSCQVKPEWKNYVVYGQYAPFKGSIGQNCKDWITASGRTYQPDYYQVVSRTGLLNQIDPLAEKTYLNQCLYQSTTGTCTVQSADLPAPANSAPVSVCDGTSANVLTIGGSTGPLDQVGLEYQFQVRETKTPFKPHWEFITKNKNNNNSLTSTNPLVGNTVGQIGQTCNAWLSSIGYGNDRVRLFQRKDLWATINTSSPFAVSNVSPFINPAVPPTEANCVYVAKTEIYDHANRKTVQPTRPYPIKHLSGGAWNLEQRFECLVLPKGQQPPTNQTWDNLAADNPQRGKIKNYRPAHECTSYYKAPNTATGQVGPTYELQFFVETE